MNLSRAPRLAGYLARAAADATPVDPAAVAQLAALDHLFVQAPTVARAIASELRDQRATLKLIASENFSSLAVQLAQGNWLTDKYAEGFPGHRFYAGCDNVDAIEAEAVKLACELFGAEHAYVQPHSGADANLVAFLAILAARVEAPLAAKVGQKDLAKWTREDWARLRSAFGGQRLLALDYYSGGHLTHGYRHNLSSRLFDVHTYTVDGATGLIDLGRGPRPGVAGAPVDPAGGLQRLPAPDRLRPHAGHRRRGRRRAHGRHGALRRAGRRQGVHRTRTTRWRTPTS